MFTVLFFDTETNGLPTDRNAFTRDTEKWPHILQISWTLKSYQRNDEKVEGRIISSETHYIHLPDAVPFNDRSAAIHNISESVVRKAAESRDVLERFKKDAQSADVLIAHNLAFDKPVLMAEYYRINPNESFAWLPTTDYCTMEQTKSTLRLPTRFARPNDPWKNPRLTELYEWLFKTAPTKEQLHTADGDVVVLIACFEELVRLRVVPFDKWLEALRVRHRLRSGAVHTKFE